MGGVVDFFSQMIFGPSQMEQAFPSCEMEIVDSSVVIAEVPEIKGKLDLFFQEPYLNKARKLARRKLKFKPNLDPDFISQNISDARQLQNFFKLWLPKQNKYHLCDLDRIIKIRQAFRKKMIEDAIAETKTAVELVENKTDLFANPWQASKEYLYNLIRSRNPQAGNEILLGAAKKFGYLYNLTEDKSYHNRGVALLRLGLANEKRTRGYDISLARLFDVFSSAPIYPIDSYFELKLQLLDFMSRGSREKTQALIKQLRTQLCDPTFGSKDCNQRHIKAHGSNIYSAQGYLHRLRLLRAQAAYYQRGYDLNEAIGLAQQSRAFALREQALGLGYLTVYGLNYKDLRHDAIMSFNLEGKLLFKQGKFQPAVDKFFQVLNQPLAVRKYGGFGNLGLEAFARILFVVLNQASRESGESDQDFKRRVAKEFSRLIENRIGWNKIDRNKDLKEILGLLVRTSSLSNWWQDKTGVEIDLWQTLGNWSLYLGGTWAPKDWIADVESEVELNTIKDPLEKVDTIVRALTVTDIEPTLLREIRNLWDLPQ